MHHLIPVLLEDTGNSLDGYYHLGTEGSRVQTISVLSKLIPSSIIDESTESKSNELVVLGIDLVTDIDIIKGEVNVK